MALSPIEYWLTTMLSTYWQEHRCASDTVEGIRCWWLPEAHGCPIEHFGAALAWLTKHELVEDVAAADGRIRYRLRRDVTDESFVRIAHELAAPGLRSEEAER